MKKVREKKKKSPKSSGCTQFHANALHVRTISERAAEASRVRGHGKTTTSDAKERDDKFVSKHPARGLIHVKPNLFRTVLCALIFVRLRKNGQRIIRECHLTRDVEEPDETVRTKGKRRKQNAYKVSSSWGMFMQMLRLKYGGQTFCVSRKNARARWRRIKFRCETGFNSISYFIQGYESAQSVGDNHTHLVWLTTSARKSRRGIELQLRKNQYTGLGWGNKLWPVMEYSSASITVIASSCSWCDAHLLTLFGAFLEDPLPGRRTRLSPKFSFERLLTPPVSHKFQRFTLKNSSELRAVQPIINLWLSARCIVLYRSTESHIVQWVIKSWLEIDDRVRLDN